MKNDMPETLWVIASYVDGQSFDFVADTDKHIFTDYAKSTKYIRTDLTEPKPMEDAAPCPEPSNADYGDTPDSVRNYIHFLECKVDQLEKENCAASIRQGTMVFNPHEYEIVNKTVQPVIDDDLLAEAIAKCKSAFDLGKAYTADNKFMGMTSKHAEILIAHAIKTREKGMSVGEFVSHMRLKPYLKDPSWTQIHACLSDNGLKIINPPNNRDEEKI